MSCNIIILAAGSSSRLGQPKQLLPYKGKTLIGHIVEIALQSEAEKVLIVLGANHLIIEKKLPVLDKLKPIYNEDWREGMASSIRKAIAFLQEEEKCPEAALIMTSDQPYINVTLLNRMIHIQKDNPKPIVASTYNGTIGTPVLFHASLFEELKKLQGDAGAKKMLMHRLDEVETVEFPDGNIDIDTEIDYRNLLMRD
jgi:molybdenum cofactor cytidylyltransferase